MGNEADVARRAACAEVLRDANLTWQQVADATGYGRRDNARHAVDRLKARRVAEAQGRADAAAILAKLAEAKDNQS